VSNLIEAMSSWEDYTEGEWQEISDRSSLKGVPTHQVGLLHRHWIWANFGRRGYEDALTIEEWNDVEDFAARTPWAMYIWYGLLYAVIEGDHRPPGKARRSARW
jgi:hypothetical protein